MDDGVDGLISYSHEDIEMMRQFKGHLDAHTPHGGPSYWADTSLNAGQRWSREIETAIGRAHVFLYFLSAGFLKSDYILNTEVPEIEKRAARCGGLIVPVLLKSCYWEPFLAVPSRGLQALPVVDGTLRPLDHPGDPVPRDPGYDRAHRILIRAVAAHTFGPTP